MHFWLDTFFPEQMGLTVQHWTLSSRSAFHPKIRDVRLCKELCSKTEGSSEVTGGPGPLSLG